MRHGAEQHDQKAEERRELHAGRRLRRRNGNVKGAPAQTDSPRQRLNAFVVCEPRNDLNCLVYLLAPYRRSFRDFETRSFVARVMNADAQSLAHGAAVRLRAVKASSENVIGVMESLASHDEVSASAGGPSGRGVLIIETQG